MAYVYDPRCGVVRCGRCGHDAGFRVRSVVRRDLLFDAAGGGDGAGEDVVCRESEYAYCSVCDHRMGKVDEIFSDLGGE